MNPAAYAELADGVGRACLAVGNAWVCLNCDNFGLMSAPKSDLDGIAPAVNLGGQLDPDTDHSVACGSAVEWIDPASVGSLDRTVFIDARKRHGLAALLDGHASRCPECNHIRFYPHEHDYYPDFESPAL